MHHNSSLLSIPQKSTNLFYLTISFSHIDNFFKNYNTRAAQISTSLPSPFFKLRKRGKREGGGEGGGVTMARRKNPVLYKLKRALALIVSKRTIAQKLLMLKKTRKYKLFKHYNYSYIGEYQFSPSNSNTPLMFHHNCSSKKRRSRVLSLLCGSKTLDFGEFEALPLSEEIEGKELVEFLPISNEQKEVVEELEDNGEEKGIENGGEEGEETEEKNGEDNGEDDESVDGRAERFIERFYQEMRLQRQDSFVQWKVMLQRSV